MLKLTVASLLLVSSCKLAVAGDSETLPKDILPVIGTAVAAASSISEDDDYEKWLIKLICYNEGSGQIQNPFLESWS